MPRSYIIISDDEDDFDMVSEYDSASERTTDRDNGADGNLSGAHGAAHGADITTSESNAVRLWRQLIGDIEIRLIKTIPIGQANRDLEDRLQRFGEFKAKVLSLLDKSEGMLQITDESDEEDSIADKSDEEDAAVDTVVTSSAVVTGGTGGDIPDGHDAEEEDTDDDDEDGGAPVAKRVKL
ncbi:hypothetical protein V490_09368 [Pseudogymnoascus sp. VKM F-3557]|nr:hypothetical protein V490_09368 [Pseudogymnoascus sp. VKM F-3557]